MRNLRSGEVRKLAYVLKLGKGVGEEKTSGKVGKLEIREFTISKFETRKLSNTGGYKAGTSGIRIRGEKKFEVVSLESFGNAHIGKFV